MYSYNFVADSGEYIIFFVTQTLSLTDVLGVVNIRLPEYRKKIKTQLLNHHCI